MQRQLQAGEDEKATAQKKKKGRGSKSSQQAPKAPKAAGSSGGGDAGAVVEEWMADRKAVHAWMERLKLEEKVGSRDKPELAKFRNVLPAAVAEDLYAMVSSMPDDYWETDADKGGGTASHEYKVVAPSDTAGVTRGLASSSPLERRVAQVYDALGAVCGVSSERVYTFQMARYTKGHFIEPHDDTAYIELDDTPGQCRNHP